MVGTITGYTRSTPTAKPGQLPFVRKLMIAVLLQNKKSFLCGKEL